MIVDQFAGPGGWEEGLRLLGRTEDILGFEIDDDACATRTAAGHLTAQEDVSEVDPWEAFAGVFEGIIASAPCPAFSSAGKQEGIEDIPRLLRLAREARHGVGPEIPREGWQHPESRLVLEPLRWAAALRPRWIACEQVKEVLPFWRAAAETLQLWGYRTWAGILNAADYGVPQTRRRAILMASLDVQPHAPNPTHHDPRKTMPMFGQPWVSMAEALGWGLSVDPAGTVVAGASRTGGDAPLDGGSGAWRRYTKAQEDGGWIVRTGCDSGRQERSADEPAPLLTSKSGGQWVVRTGNNSEKAPAELEAYERSCDEPSPTVDTKAGTKWVVKGSGYGERRAVRTEDEPAPTLAFGNDGASWARERPATTVCGDARFGRPGHKDRDKGEAQFEKDSIKITVQEAAILQGFRPDYPWQDSRTSQFRQIGNAIPPPLAAAVLRVLGCGEGEVPASLTEVGKM